MVIGFARKSDTERSDGADFRAVTRVHLFLAPRVWDIVFGEQPTVGYGCCPGIAADATRSETQGREILSSRARPVDYGRVSRSSRTRQYTFRTTAVHAKMVNNKRPQNTKVDGNNDKSLFLVLDYIVARGPGRSGRRRAASAKYIKIQFKKTTTVDGGDVYLTPRGRFLPASGNYFSSHTPLPSYDPQ